MEIQSAPNPVYANQARTRIDLDVKFAEFDEAIPFAATPDDVEEHGRTLFENAVRGDYGVIGDYVLPPLPPIQIPPSVSMRQARLALLGAGLYEQVETFVAVMDGEVGEQARIEWEFATEVRRDSPLVTILATALELSEEQLDALFIEAAAL
jgi:hypothetical protein